MTKPLDRSATATLLRRLQDAGGTGIPIDKHSATDLAALRTLARRAEATISFGRAFRVVQR